MASENIAILLVYPVAQLLSIKAKMVVGVVKILLNYKEKVGTLFFGFAGIKVVTRGEPLSLISSGEH